MGKVIALVMSFLFLETVHADITCKEVKTVWKPSIKSLCSPSGFGYQRSYLADHPAQYDQRNRCVNIPKFGGEVLAIRTYQGMYNSLMDHNREIKGLSATHVKFTVQMYLDSNYEYFAGGRLPIGIKIGPVGENTNCISGGCPPERQDGGSVRVNYNSEVSRDGVPRMVLKAYSYHLNRKTPRFVSQSSYGESKPRLSQFGDNFPLDGTIPYGRWVTVSLEVKLNRLGHADGFINMEAYWDGPNGRIVRKGGAKGLEFRDEVYPKWKIVGAFMTDKFNTQERAPASQSVYYRNHRMTTCN